MTSEEALEYFYYNVVGGWHGETTPLFVESVSFTEACESYWEEENERTESEKNLGCEEKLATSSWSKRKTAQLFGLWTDWRFLFSWWRLELALLEVRSWQ